SGDCRSAATAFVCKLPNEIDADAATVIHLTPSHVSPLRRGTVIDDRLHGRNRRRALTAAREQGALPPIGWEDCPFGFALLRPIRSSATADFLPPASLSPFPSRIWRSTKAARPWPEEPQARQQPRS